MVPGTCCTKSDQILDHQEQTYFFFPSRRRHTRLQGDWSSDVCSSDLPAAGPGGPIASGSMTTVRPEHVTTAAVPPRDLAAALRGAGLTGVDDSARRRAEYSADASNYRVVPSVVVFPRHVDEAAAALDVARRAGVPVTSRGAGTSIAGNAIGSGVVLDFSRHLNRILAVDPEARAAVVEPGALLDDITTAAAGHGLRFGPDPSTHSRAS